MNRKPYFSTAKTTENILSITYLYSLYYSLLTDVEYM